MMMAELNTFFDAYLQALGHNIFVVLVVVCVAADMLFGCIRAMKYHCWNSAVGIDGGIRKVTMLLSVAFLALIDQMVGVNLISWLPEDTTAFLDKFGVKALGLAEFFSVAYILFEAVSILKNWMLCGVWVPAGIKDKLAAWLDEMTDESSISVTQTLATGKHKQVAKVQPAPAGKPCHLSPGQLATFEERDLRALATACEIDIPADATRADLIDRLVDVPVEI